MIWYSHVNEDSAPERLALAACGARTAVVVAGSGERLIALLDAPHLDRVVVVDSNPHALRLAQAKIAALRLLEVDEYLALLGHREATVAERRGWWQRVQAAEPMDGPDVSAGLLHVGALERWFARLRPWLHVWLGRSFTRWTNEGLSASLAATFPRRRFAVLMWLFSRRPAYQWTGNRDPAFVDSEADHGRIAGAFRDGLRNGTLGANPMAHLVFAGHLRGMEPEAMPFSLQPRVIAGVKERLSSLPLEFVVADLADTANDLRLPWGGRREAVFSSLSDLASFLCRETCARIVARATSAPGSTAVVRSFLRNRLPPRAAARNLSAHERTGMYDVHEYRFGE